MPKLIVSFNEQAVKDSLRELIRKTIEETINAMLDEEADQLVGAGPYERTDERAAYHFASWPADFSCPMRTTLRPMSLRTLAKPSSVKAPLSRSS